MTILIVRQLYLTKLVFKKPNAQHSFGKIGAFVLPSTLLLSIDICTLFKLFYFLSPNFAKRKTVVGNAKKPIKPLNTF